MPFEFVKQSIEDVILVKPMVLGDDRGFFVETYKYSEFFKNGIKDKFVQDNCSFSTKDVLRGLHYQSAPKAQAKLVSCSKGKILDVAVDIRKDSKTFGKWVGVVLSEENKSMLYIPKGFAHGFVVLSDVAELRYKVSEEYSPLCDRGILWNDKDINVNWFVDNPILSEKDKKQPSLKDINLEEVL